MVDIIDLHEGEKDHINHTSEPHNRQTDRQASYNDLLCRPVELGSRPNIVTICSESRL